MPWMRSSLWIPLLSALPCGPCRRLVETHPCYGKKGGCQSVLWIPQGPAPGLERLGKKDYAPPPVTDAPLASPSSCIPTAAPGEVVLLQKPRRQSLEKSWRGGHGLEPLTLRQSLAWLLEPTSLIVLQRRCLRGWNSDHAFLDAQGGYWDEREFGGGQGSGTLPNFPRLLKEVAGSETKALPPLWCRVNFSVRDRVEGREFGTLRNKEQQRPLGARDGTQFAGSEGVR